MRGWLCAAAILLVMLALPAAAAEDPCGPCHPTPGAQSCFSLAGAKPIVETHKLPPYPEMSVMTGEEGTTLLEVRLGPDGVPGAVSIVHTSGSLRLDEAARDYVKESWRWTPPLKQCAVNPVGLVSIKWDLRDAQDSGPRPPAMVMTLADYPPDALARREQGVVVLYMILLKEGGVAMAKVAKSSGFPDLDAKGLEIGQARANWTPARMNGQPVNTPMYVAVQWRLDPPKPAP